MTEQTQQPAAPADPFQQVWQSIQESTTLLKGRIKQAKSDAGKPVTAGALATILEGDVLRFLANLVELTAQLRDGTAQAVSALESRIDDLEERVDGETTTITPDDAATLRQVVLDLRELIPVLRSSGAPEEKVALYEQHAVAAEAILDDATLVEESEDGAEDDGEDEDESED